MNLRLGEADIAALRVRARLEDVSVQAIVQVAIREYIERHRRAERVDSVLDRELPRYAEALRRLAE